MKTKFATQRLGHINADTDEAIEIIREIHTEALDAVFVRQQALKVERLLLAIKQQLRDGIEPLLERQAPQLETRLAKVEAEYAALAALVTQIEAQINVSPEQPHLVSRPGLRRES